MGGINYGRGSSREHAALSPMFLGVKAVMAKSFARIHLSNLINFGVLPLTFKEEKDYDRIAQGNEIEIEAGDLKEKTVTVVDKTKNEKFAMIVALDERKWESIKAGGTLAYLKRRGRETDRCSGES